MTEANAARYREQLVLGLDDDGLEDLTLRLVRPDWPQAHRTYRGPDGGVDVFSDYELPPEHAWQCKNYADGSVDWSKCRRSLTTAMDQEKPRNDTFVFPRALKKKDHDYWRETFTPWAREKFGDETPILDYWDDLADRLQDRPDLVDKLADGAVGGYVRKVLEQTATDDVNPLSTASDHIDTAAKLAERAEQLGKHDPYFAYGGAGRDAHAGDRDIPPDRVRFTMDRSQDDALPRYAVSVRRGNRIHEITAAPREGTTIKAPRLMFSDDGDGAELRKSARLRLAKGQKVTLNSPLVRLDPGGVADKFRHLTDDDGALHGGEIVLGLSEPLKLSVTTTAGETTLSEELTMYRIPEEPGDRTAWGGSVGGTVLMFDLRPATTATMSN